jgi:hypothetical protein
MINKKMFLAPSQRLSDILDSIQASVISNQEAKELGIYGEYQPKNYRGLIDFSRSVQESLVHHRTQSMSLGSLTCYPNTSQWGTKNIQAIKNTGPTSHHPKQPHAPIPKESWYFINNTGLSAAMAMINCQTLAKLFNRPVQFIHFQSTGLLGTLKQWMMQTRYTQLDQMAHKITDNIAQTLETQDKVVFICHGTGALLLKALLKQLAEHTNANKLLHKIEIYTIGCVLKKEITSDLPNQNALPYVEHFANTQDLFALTGILSNPTALQGPLYTLKKSGHLLNNNYLYDLVQGLYCQKKSRLYQHFLQSSQLEEFQWQQSA